MTIPPGGRGQAGAWATGNAPFPAGHEFNAVRLGGIIKVWYAENTNHHVAPRALLTGHGMTRIEVEIEMKVRNTTVFKRTEPSGAKGPPAGTTRSWFFVGLLVLLNALSVPGAGATDDFSALVDTLERAVVRSDAETLIRCRRDLERDSQNRAVDASLRRYTAAYVIWRISDLSDEKERERLLEEAEGILVDLVRRHPEHAEALALLGSVYGAQIGGAWSGMTLGPKAGEALDRAGRIAPNNPRVALQQGISAFFRPRMFGGGLELAAEKLRLAEALFEKEPASKSWPDWGRIDVYAWLGQVLVETGEYRAAAAAYEKGLSLEPDHAWIKNELLPMLERSGRRDGG